jgi:hypothetical protein
MSVGQLAGHIGAGRPWMPALLDEGQRRLQDYSNYAEVLALDIDGGLTIEDAIALAFIAAHCGLGIESASSTPEHNKFRLVFRLATPIEGWQNIRIANQYLALLVGNADPNCKDASRFFFGAPGRSAFLLNESATLPPTFMADALAWHEGIEAEERRRADQARRQWESHQDANPGLDTDALIRSALASIPPDCDYNTWIALGMALAGMGDQWLSDWDGWSAGGTSYKPGECDHKWGSFRGKRAAPEVIFGIAKRYGWRFPKKSWADRIADRLRRKPTPQAAAKALKAKLQDAPYTGHEYEAGQRLSTWQQAIAQGYKFILDGSGTGTGKSHDAGMLRPEMFGDRIGQLLYLSNGHYSATTATLAEWADLHGRHNGLTTEVLPDGTERLRRAQRGEERATPANCSRHAVINALRSKNVGGSDSAGVVCGTCPVRDACVHSQGAGYGFLNQRKDALQADRLRLHPASAPPTDYEYSKVLALWDEPSESFTVTQAVEVTADDVRQTAGHLAMTAPAIFDQLRPLLTAVGELFDAQQGRYGIGHFDILAALPALPTDLDIAALSAALAPDLDFLDPEVEDGLRVSDLPGRSIELAGGNRVNLRRNFSEDGEAQQAKADGVIKQWLGDLVLVLTGAGALNLRHETLTITRPDFRQRAIAQAAAANVFLDATLSAADLSLLLNCEVSDIYICRQRGGPVTNLKITQVSDLGRLGMSRGADQQRRVAALVAHYKAIDPGALVLDFKKFDADGAWWRDSRGVNSFQAVNTMVLVGTPCANLAALQAKYSCLVGTFPTADDLGFAEWCDRIIRADIHQAVGRPRANRRPGESLNVILLSNFDTGLPVEEVEAKDVTIQAGSKVQRAAAAIQAAVSQLRAQGTAITQRAIAAAVGLSQSRIWQLRDMITFAIEDSSSKSNQDSGDPPPELAPLIWGAVNLCATEADLRSTMADLLTGIVDGADLLWILSQPPPTYTQA